MLVWPCSIENCVPLVVDDAERHQQRADQLEAAAEMIDVVDLGERDQRLDRDRRGGLLERGERRVRRRRAAPAR